MELQIFDQNIELIGVVDSYISLIWRSRYHKCGDFELHCPLTPELSALIKCGNIVYKGCGDAGYIETVEISNDMTDEQTIVVKGRLCTGYLASRINWGQFVFTGSTETLMRDMTARNCITPADSKRRIPVLALGEPHGYPETISYQDSYGNLLECLESISSTSELGFLITMNPKEKKLLFDVYKGIDRTVNQSTIPPIIFSKRFDTISKLLYVNSSNNYRCTALVDGEGEAQNKTSVVIGKDYAGLNRYEIYVDATSLTRKANSESDQEIPLPEYEKMLVQKGQEKLKECAHIRTFDGTVDTKSSVKYREDFMVGDIVTITDDACGVTLDTRITEVEEVYEGSGHNINVIFGNNIPTLTEKIKQKLR